jgi:hypothetical protein
MNTQLLAAVLSQKEKIGDLSAASYEKAVGKTWKLFYKGRKITFLGEKEFTTTAWGEDAWGEEGFQSLKLCYSYLDTDTLLDIYLVLLDMEAHFEEVRAQAFWEELGLKKLVSKTDNGNKSQVTKFSL